MTDTSMKYTFKPTYTFMEVGVKNENGERNDEKFFVGRLPREGETVEMVYVGRNATSGDLRFQLRVVEKDLLA